MSTTAAFGAVPNTAQKSVGTSAARLVAVPANQRSRAGNGVLVKAPLSNTNPVFIGGAGVTTATGLVLEKGVDLWLPACDPSVLYAIVASGTETLCVLWF